MTKAVMTSQPAGRPSRGPTGLYNQTRHKKIVKAIRKGNSLGTAGQLAGLGKETLHSWLDKARRYPEEYPQFVKLEEDIKLARAEREAEHVAKIERVALGNEKNTWQAAAWYLERTNAEEWGRKDKVSVSADAPLVQINQVVLSDESARASARDLLRRATGPDAGAREPLGISVRSESEEE